MITGCTDLKNKIYRPCCFCSFIFKSNECIKFRIENKRIYSKDVIK